MFASFIKFMLRVAHSKLAATLSTSDYTRVAIKAHRWRCFEFVFSFAPTPKITSEIFSMILFSSVKYHRKWWKKSRKEKTRRRRKKKVWDVNGTGIVCFDVIVTTLMIIVALRCKHMRISWKILRDLLREKVFFEQFPASDLDNWAKNHRKNSFARRKVYENFLFIIWRKAKEKLEKNSQEISRNLSISRSIVALTRKLVFNFFLPSKRKFSPSLRCKIISQ